MATLISHFYNEEFLLPFWIEHHRHFFDRVLLFDYDSTDSSRRIIAEMAPEWEVRTSRNRCFDAAACDWEVMEAEREFPGWKIVLNTTEFLVCGDIRRYCEERECDGLSAVFAWDFCMVDRLEDADKLIESSVPLARQRQWGYHSANFARTRMLHRMADGQYMLGRHGSNAYPVREAHVRSDIGLLWFGWSPMAHVRPRKLQIQTRMPQSDKDRGFGWEHIKSPATLQAEYLRQAASSGDLSRDSVFAALMAASTTQCRILPLN